MAQPSGRVGKTTLAFRFVLRVAFRLELSRAPTEVFADLDRVDVDRMD